MDMIMMEFRGAVSDLVNKVLLQTSNFVHHSPLNFIIEWVPQILSFTFNAIKLTGRILLAVLSRLIFGRWLKFLNVVPFQIHEKNDYYQDPGVLEMKAMLRGEDCYDTCLDQRQKLPFAPADFDPFDKIYLARYFHRAIRSIRNTHVNLVERDGIMGGMYRRINGFVLYQNFMHYIFTRVAVNIND